MNRSLKTLNIHLSIHIKNFAKALFSFLLVVSFLASCMTDDSTGITDSGDTTAPIFTCPEATETVSLSIPFGMTELTLTDTLTSLAVTDETDTTAPAITYEPATVNAETTSVIATATDEAGNEATCTFTVAVTQSVESTILTDTTLTCNPDTTSTTFNADGEDIILAEVLANVAGITASDSGSPVTDVTFVYNPPMLSEVGEQEVIVTVIDNEGNVGTSGGVVAECRFDFTVIPRPTLSACPADIPIAEIAVDNFTWTTPTIENGPEGAAVEVSVMSTDVDASTAATVTVTTDTETTGTFTMVGTYTVTFTAMDGTSPVMVNESPLSCSFEVNAMSRPTNSEFFLAMNDAAPGPNNPFLIRTDDDLAMLATVVNANQLYFNINMDAQNVMGVPYRTADYRLENDIDLSSVTSFTSIGTGLNNGGVITCSEMCFEGTFDGASNTISGLDFDGVNTTNVGLFAIISGENTSISDLLLTDINITGPDNVGGLVGLMMDSSSISNVFAEGSVSGVTNVGGLVGRMESMSSMTNASASVDVTASSSLGGGLVGSMSDSHITNAFASGNVTGLQILGGLVGQLDSSSSITNAYASGTVGNNIETSTGGLVGNLFNSSLTNTLARGTVSGSPFDISAGALEGSNLSSTITASYWDSTVNLISATITSDGREQTTEQLQMPTAATATTGIYADWNSLGDAGNVENNVWDFGENNEYPAITGLFISVECQREPSGNDLEGNACLNN